MYYYVLMLVRISITLTYCSVICSSELHTDCKSCLSLLHHCDVSKATRLRDSVACGIELHGYSCRESEKKIIGNSL